MSKTSRLLYIPSSIYLDIYIPDSIAARLKNKWFWFCCRTYQASCKDKTRTSTLKYSLIRSLIESLVLTENMCSSTLTMLMWCTLISRHTKPIHNHMFIHSFTISDGRIAIQKYMDMLCTHIQLCTCVYSNKCFLKQIILSLL